MQILVPKKLAKFTTLQERPFFFLAGPIRGGSDWQHQMCLELQQLAANCVIACPCRWHEWPGGHPLAEHFVDLPGGDFPHQLDWERRYLDLAGRSYSRGCIIFWLPAESATRPHPGPEPYAMDTRGELGRWSVHKAYNPTVRVVVGAGEGFFGLSQIRRNLCADMDKDFPIYPTMAETAAAAMYEVYEQ